MTMREEINEIEKEIEEVEQFAIHTISEIVRKVEEVTGQQFRSLTTQTGIRITSQLKKDTEKKAVKPVIKEGTLRNHMTQLGVWVNQNYDFESPCVFREWAESYFMEGWREKGVNR
jgi:hypothetical protein